MYFGGVLIKRLNTVYQKLENTDTYVHEKHIMKKKNRI